ncbi:unnamed protein product [Peronospora destructor]|uniref:Uncharacterized protein n=1 Tax=Peronospora destructor TaxID=86335 RepID=A0AAV0TXE9_9STRA|nr:unnamed protein product [Peronospora destructor]
MSSSIPSTNTSSTWRKRVGRPKEPPNSNLGSWFVSKFVNSSKNKNKLLREHDEETAQNIRRRPVGTLSAVTNQQQANAARREELGRPKPMRQKSFLRQQLQEMKRQSAETLQLVQKRMNGELIKEEEDDDNVEEKISSSEDEDEGLHVVDDSEDVIRGSVSSNPATSQSWSPRRSSTSSRRRSVAEEQQEREDELMAHEAQRHEYSEEVNRRMSQATQLYAEAITALDYALHPERRRRQPDHEPSPKPLLLGVKKGSANMPKSEWI